MHRIRIEKERGHDENGKEIVIETPIHEYTINCRFCGKETGHITFREPRPELDDDMTPVGIKDSRCDGCKSVHGEFER